MSGFAMLVTWFWEHYPPETGWSIQTSVGKDNTIRVAIKRYTYEVLVHYEAVNRRESLCERQEQAIRQAIEQLKGCQALLGDRP